MKNPALQDVILNAVRKDRQLVTVHLVNGLPLKGFVRAFDNFVLLLDSPEGKQMMVYKHAISTITPTKPVTYSPAEEERENAGSRAD